jgi:hypothetical protein
MTSLPGIHPVSGLGEAAYYDGDRLVAFKRGTRVTITTTGKPESSTIAAGEKQVMEQILENL